MFCTQCGFQNTADSNFCKKCGLPLKSIAGTSSARQVEPIQRVIVQTPPQQAQPKIIVHQKSSAGAVLLTLFLVGIIAFVGIGAFVRYQREQQQKKIFGFEINNDGISTSWNLPQSSSQPTQQRTTQTTTTQPSYNASSSSSNSSSGRCFLSNNGNSVNARSGCDDHDCASDESTIYTSLPDGTEINILTNQQSISSGKGYDWLPIEYDGYVVYVASSKVSCE